MYVKINGEMHYLWRAVDHEGVVLESCVTKKREKLAALRFLKKAMKRYGRPATIVTDGLRSYPAAMRELGNPHLREMSRWLNNRAENSHRAIPRFDRPIRLHMKSTYRATKVIGTRMGVRTSRHLPPYVTDRATSASHRRCGEAGGIPSIRASLENQMVGGIRTFYKQMDQLATKQTSPMALGILMQRPIAPRGVYFFFEAGEHRSDSGNGPRITRIGTHGLRAGTTSTLRSRLRQHHGTRSGIGDHRGSIFRLLTGDALLRAGAAAACASWGNKDFVRLGLDRATVRRLELSLEQTVSARLAAMPVLWLEIDDPPSPDSLRGLIERNAIALLSNDGKSPIDAPSPGWLGHHSSRPHVRASGLWNQNHVDEQYDPAFLDTLERLIQQSGR